MVFKVHLFLGAPLWALLPPGQICGFAVYKKGHCPNRPESVVLNNRSIVEGKVTTRPLFSHVFLALSLEEEGSRPFGPASQRLLRDGPQLGVPTSQQFRLFPPCMEGPVEAGPQGWAFGFRVWLKVPGLSVPLWYLSVDPRRNSWGWLPFTMGA